MSGNETRVYYVDGEFVPHTEATIPVSDLAVLRGYGVFDFMRTYGGVVFRLEDHLARLERSAALVGLPLPWSREELRRVVAETLARNPREGECYVRIVVTGGTSDDGITPSTHPRLVVCVDPVRLYPAWQHERGVAAITVRDERYLPEAKTINYIPAIVAVQKARAQGADEAIFVDPGGHALEATRSNLFAFFGDTLATPGAGILCGITRQAVLEVAASRFTVEVRAIPLRELLAADEVFITATTKEIMPVAKIDGTAIGGGSPGKRTREMMQLFREYASEYIKRQ